MTAESLVVPPSTNPGERATWGTAWAIEWGLVLLVGVVLFAGHWWRSPGGEPWKNHDETRHILTGIFLRDALLAGPAAWQDPAGYAIRYYLQYPALGLLVWPPGFYAIEGLVMAVAGAEVAVARGVLVFFVILAALGVRAWARLHLHHHEATAAMALFLLSPLVFEYSRFVMLEMPTLAWVVWSLVGFEWYLREPKRRYAWLACGAAAMAVLTRFDGLLLLIYVGVRLVGGQHLVLLRRPALWWPILLAAIVTGPVYLLTYLQYQTGLTTAATQGTSHHGEGLRWLNLWLYLQFLPQQLGYVWLTLGLIGAWATIFQRQAKSLVPAGSLILATYAFFVPLAEPESRHAIYWIPAWAILAVVGVRILAAEYGHRLGVGLALLGFITTGYLSLKEPGWSVHGYRAAAAFVLGQPDAHTRPVLMDGVLTGGFILQVRLQDPERRVTVARGDKLIYAMLSDPRGGYQQYAQTEADVLRLLEELDPAWIVLEEPALFYMHLEGAELLRRTIQRHPERFPLVATIPLTGTHDEFSRGRLDIYQKPQRNPAARGVQSVPVLGLGKSLSAPVETPAPAPTP